MRSTSPRAILSVYPTKTFDDLIMGQSSSQGFWQNKALVLSFFLDPESAINAVEILTSGMPDKDNIGLTLLALYIFQVKFEDREDEWQLIGQKAKKYLRDAGLPKFEALLKSFKIQIK